MDNRPIGVFDSGIGGLTVVNALAKVLPDEAIFYVGDTARVPYGNKSEKSIQQFSYEITNWLIQQDCEIIVVACNTVSSIALQELKNQFSLPIIGVIDPVVNHAIISSRNSNIGILGTQATIKSDAYQKCIMSINSKINIVSQACPLFVPLVEEGWVSGKVPLSIASVYLEKIKNTNVDTVILGCTHYPFLKNVINKVLGNKIQLVDSGESTAKIVAALLHHKKLLTDKHQGGIRCFVTDDPKSFDAFAIKFLNRKILKTNIIDLF